MTKRKVCVVGNYRFTGKVLGKGNFAKVEEASHELLGIKVAVKIMDLNNIKEDYVIRNLFREARIMSKLKHPCIVSLFETMQKADNSYYIITEIINGGDLCTFVKDQRGGKLDEKATKVFAQQFVSAILHMHQRGIVHRDLKMENVMLNAAQNQIKIVDFGLSNEWTTESPLKTHCGSPEYAAPELFVTSKVYGPEVDLWSLGIIIYGMIVGKLPFVSTKSSSVSSPERRKLLVAQINKGMSVSQRKTIACYSFEFRSAINRLLTADSKKRITIKEMSIHPWITENGKVIVRSNPTKKITSLAQNKVISDINAVSKVDCSDILKALTENPYGKIGGMYNILAHKITTKCYTSNQVTRSLSETSAFDMKSRKVIDTEESPKKIQTAAPPEDKRYWETNRPQTITTTSCETSRTKTILTTRVRQLSSNHSTSSSKTKEPPYTKTKRPQTVQIGKINEIKENSAFRKRQEYSAFIASSLNNQRNSKRIKYKKSDIENDAQANQKRRKESAKGAIISPKRSFSVGEKSNSKQTTKVSDSYLLEKPPITPKRKQSLDQTSNPKSSASTSRSRKNSTAKHSSPLATLMQFIDTHGDILRSGRPTSRGSKRIPQKTETFGCAVVPNASKKSPVRIKLKTMRPASSRPPTEGNKVTAKREK